MSSADTAHENLPGGLRLGVPALTSRGFTEESFAQVVLFIDKAVRVASVVKAKTGTLEEFKQFLDKDSTTVQNLKSIRQEVEDFASQFTMPGFTQL